MVRAVTPPILSNEVSKALIRSAVPRQSRENALLVALRRKAKTSDCLVLGVVHSTPTGQFEPAVAVLHFKLFDLSARRDPSDTDRRSRRRRVLVSSRVELHHDDALLLHLAFSILVTVNWPLTR